MLATAPIPTAAPYLAAANNYGPLYLTGTSGPEIRQAAAGPLWGRLGVLLGPATFGGPGTKCNYADHLADFCCWGLDNGCFTSRGAFHAEPWLERLEEIVETIPDAHERCCFAVAPDVFNGPELGGDMAATIERSLPILPRIRALGVPAALVMQDDAHTMIDSIPWDAFDVAFLGGRDAFKLGFPVAGSVGATSYTYDRTSEQTQLWAQLIHRCHVEGKPVHVGRVSSAIRMAFGRDIWADSCDGTYLARRGTRLGLPEIDDWTTDPADLETRRSESAGQPMLF